jgi:hypothetical protein
LLCGLALLMGCSAEPFSLARQLNLQGPSVTACGQPPERPFFAPLSDNTSAAGRLWGVGFTPRSAQHNDIIAFFKTARGAGNAMVWAGDWKELEYARGFPMPLVEQCYVNNLTVVIELPPSNNLGASCCAIWTKNDAIYVDGAADFVSEYPPHYLDMSVDVDALYTRSPADFAKFVKLFERTYDAVKAVSPGTRIFTVFQLEKLNGLNGGRYGGANDA